MLKIFFANYSKDSICIPWDFPRQKRELNQDIKKLFNQKDAEMFLNMSPMLEAPESIAQRLGRPVEELAGQLEDMAKRGLLFRLRKGDSVKYGAIPFMHGLAEFQVKRFDQELRNLLISIWKRSFISCCGGGRTFHPHGSHREIHCSRTARGRVR